MIPPLMSSTLSSSDILGKSEQSKGAKTQNNTGAKAAPAEKKAAGRPETPDD
jgi:hypothetical protein